MVDPISRELLGQVGDVIEIIKWVEKRLVISIPGAEHDLVQITADPNVALQTTMDRFWNITPGPHGTIDQSAIAGGGFMQVSTATRLIVTCHIGNLLDVPNRIPEFIRVINQERKNILRALSFQVPEDENGVSLVNEPILPQDWNWERNGTGGSVQVGFGLEYDEDLSVEGTP